MRLILLSTREVIHMVWVTILVTSLVTLGLQEITGGRLGIAWGTLGDHLGVYWGVPGGPNRLPVWNLGFDQNRLREVDLEW